MVKIELVMFDVIFNIEVCSELFFNNFVKSDENC